MIYPPIDKILTKVGSKYELAVAVAKRSREIKYLGNYQMALDKYKNHSGVGKALEEVAANYITIVN